MFYFFSDTVFNALTSRPFPVASVGPDPVISMPFPGVYTPRFCQVLKMVFELVTGAVIKRQERRAGIFRSTCTLPNILLPAGISDYELHIYNRWGENVHNADDAGDCWDGTYKGQPCDVGVYFYYYKLKSPNCKAEMEGKGDITLVR